MVNIDQHHRLYRQVKWIRLRDEVIRDHPFCQDCTTRLSQEVHHVVHRELNLENFYDRSILRALCRPCHAVRTRRGE